MTSPNQTVLRAAALVDLVAGGKDVFAFFKHEATPEGALYAERLLAKAREPRGEGPAAS